MKYSFYCKLFREYFREWSTFCEDTDEIMIMTLSLPYLKVKVKSTLLEHDKN